MVLHVHHRSSSFISNTCIALIFSIISVFFRTLTAGIQGTGHMHCQSDLIEKHNAKVKRGGRCIFIVPALHPIFIQIKSLHPSMCTGTSDITVKMKLKDAAEQFGPASMKQFIVFIPWVIVSFWTAWGNCYMIITLHVRKPHRFMSTCGLFIKMSHLSFSTLIIAIKIRNRMTWWEHSKNRVLIMTWIRPLFRLVNSDRMLSHSI